MAFWTDNNVQPKRNYRFVVQANTETQTSVIWWWAKTITLPSFEVSETEAHFLDNKYYFPGRLTWNDVTMTVTDPKSVDVVKTVAQQQVDAGYAISNAEGGTYKTIAKTLATTALGEVAISVYDANGTDVLEKWTLHNVWMKSAKFGDLDYSNEDFKMVELTLRYDWAEHTAKGDNAPRFQPS